MQFTLLIAAMAGAVSAAVTKRNVGPYTGTMKFQNPDAYGQIGACGIPLSVDSVAIANVHWTAANPNEDPLCGKTIRITSNGVTLTGVVQDKQPSGIVNAVEVMDQKFPQFGLTLAQGTAEATWEVLM